MLRIRSIVVAAFALTVFVTGCGLLYGVGDYRVVDFDPTAEGSVGEGGPDASDCATNAECTTRLTSEGPSEAGGSDAGPIGVLEGGVAPAMCVRGHCKRLLSEDCTSVLGDYKNDDAILLATLFSTTGSQAKTNLPRQQSALLAAEEINSALGGGGVPPAKKGGPSRPLVVVSCDEVANLGRVATHLIDDLHVQGIVGPNLSQDTLDLTTKYSARAGTALMSPAAVASAISALADNNLTWRTIPSDTQRAKLLINQINVVEALVKPMPVRPLKLAIVYRDDALGQSTFSSIAGSLTFNGKPISDASNGPLVKISRYAPAVVSTQTEIAVALQDFKPDVIAGFGTAESITNILLPFEQAIEMADPGGLVRPYYVLIDSNKVKELIDGFSAPRIPPSFRQRVRGTGVTPEPASVPVFASFNGAYSSRYSDNPRVSSMGPSYDAMYAIAYALAATTDEPVSGGSIAHGFAKLGKGTRVEVGRTTILPAFQKLTAGESIDPLGTFGHLKWDANGDILGGGVEVWCVGLTGGTPYFASSGLTMDVQTQELAGAYTQCP